MRIASFTLLVSMTIAALFTGCGSSVKTVSVNGTVNYKSAPLKSGRLDFFNSKNQLVGAANLTPEGTFIATDLPREELKVTVDTGTSEASMAMAKMQTAAPSATVIATPAAAAATPIPAKYQKVETTDLKINAEPGKKVELVLAD